MEYQIRFFFFYAAVCISDVAALKPILFSSPKWPLYFSRHIFQDVTWKKRTISDAATATNTLLEEEANYFKRAKEAPFGALQCSTSCFQGGKLLEILEKSSLVSLVQFA